MIKAVFFTILILISLTIIGQDPDYTLTPISDNTIFSENDNSNGSGDYLFVGITDNGDERRALLKFDMSVLPQDIIVADAVLRMNMNKTAPGVGAFDISAHKLLGDWGEGSSDADGSEGKGANPATNDATWNYSFYDSDTWQTAGGDFENIASASASVGGNGEYEWSGNGMISDINDWLSNAENNFGWILKVNTNQRSAKRFSSKDNITGFKPVLEIFTETVKVDDYKHRDVEIYFNPANRSLQINNIKDNSFYKNIRIFSVTGQHILGVNSKTDQNKMIINLGDMAAGIYLINLELDDSTITRKFVIY